MNKNNDFMPCLQKEMIIQNRVAESKKIILISVSEREGLLVYYHGCKENTYM